VLALDIETGMFDLHYASDMRALRSTGYECDLLLRPQRRQFLPSSQTISAILTMSLILDGGVLPMKWCTLKKKKCVTEVGCDEYRTSLCESFLMCDHVTFKVWNTKTKRWEL